MAKKTKKREKQLVEICRSFSFHLNLGNYQGCDFFCSEKSLVDKKDEEKTSESLYQFCKLEVVRAINQYKKEILEKKPEEWELIKGIVRVPQKNMKEQAEESEAKQRIGREELEEGKQKLDDFIKRTENEGELVNL